jgi:hypothetical protein
MTKIDAVLLQRHISRQSDFTYCSSDDNVSWLCTKCNNQWTTTFNSIHSTGTGCPKCCLKPWEVTLFYTNEYVDGELLLRNIPISRVSSVNNSYSSATWSCDSCCTTWETTPFKVLKTSTGCPVCSMKRYSAVCIRWLDECSYKHRTHIQHAGNGGGSMVFQELGFALMDLVPTLILFMNFMVMCFMEILAYSILMINATHTLQIQQMSYSRKH